MKQESEKIKYILYCRKSTESEDRQMLSLDDQERELAAIEKREHLKVIERFGGSEKGESQSAFKRGRPIFNHVMQQIESGKAGGLLVWHPNRLARNAFDGGWIVTAMDESKLVEVKTLQRVYRNTPEDKFMLQLEFGMAKKYSDDSSVAVKRGLNTKRQKGWLPGSAPSGYLNTKTELRGENYILNDPERFHLIRKAWDLMLTGNYTPPQILEILNNQWGFRTRQTKKKGGKPMSRSTLYRIFTNPFYAGLIEYKGNLYEGKHDPIVTLEEFDRVQVLLGRKGKPRPKKHIFAFTGCMHCGECNCMITAIEKIKLIKRDNKLKSFTYYFCTRKKVEVNCSQRKTVSLENIELQIENEIEKYTILPEFRDWALEVLNEQNDKEIEDRTKIYEMQNRTLVKTQSELDELIRMRYREMIGDNFFLQEKGELEKKILQLKANLRDTEARAEKWLELTEKTFNFALYAHKAFLFGTLEVKREILKGFSQNSVLKDGKLNISPYEWFIPIGNAYPELETEYKKLEPWKRPLDSTREEALASIRLKWRGRWDLNPRSLP